MSVVSNEVICLIRLNRLYRNMSYFFTFDSLLDLKMNGMDYIYNLEIILSRTVSDPTSELESESFNMSFSQHNICE